MKKKVNRYLRWPLILGSLIFLLAAWLAPALAQSRQVRVLEIEGPVTPAMASYFERGIETAENQGDEAVIIILNTPGGAVNTTIKIVQLIRNADVPVIIYVSPPGAQAASAGSFLTAAGHAAAMAPETVIGAASPVTGSGEDIAETLYRKQTEDLKATMRNLTERRGPEAMALGEEMIDTARAVTAAEALEVGFIDVVAVDLDDLLQQLDGREVTVNDRQVTLNTAGAIRQTLSMSFIERALHALSDPFIISLLLTLAVPAIFIELNSPGGWVAGFIGVLCLGLALYGLGTLPANWLGLGLIAVAFVLMALEVKTPTVGALAAVGAITMLAGLLVLFNSPGTPEFARISIPSAVTVTLLTSSFFVFLVTKAVQAQKVQPKTGQEGLIGKEGTVRRAFSESAGEAALYRGTLLIHGELWQATSSQPLQLGQKARVEKMDGFTLRVNPI